MIPTTIESLIIVILFFLPGYLYRVVKSQFKFYNWNGSESFLSDLVFVSFLLQIISWVILKNLFKSDIIAVAVEHYSSANSSFFPLQQVVTNQTLSSLFLALLIAVITSVKQVRRFLSHAVLWSGISRYLSLGLVYDPPLNAIFEAENDFGSKFVACVIELTTGEYYEGNIKRVGFGENPEDKLIVLSRVTTLIRGEKKTLPEEFKVLIPYDKVKTISYKDIPIEQSAQKTGEEPRDFSILILFITIVILAGIFLIYSRIASPEKLSDTAVVSAITVLTTFAGVYASFRLSISQEKKTSRQRSEKTYISTLKLIFSELDLNETALKNIVSGFGTMPSDPKTFSSAYSLFIKTSKGIKTSNFYALMSTEAFVEISQYDQVFNAVQQAYYNLEMTVNGLVISHDVFSEYVSLEPVPDEIKLQAKGLVAQELEKIKRSIKLIVKAKKVISEELKERGMTFSNLS